MHHTTATTTADNGHDFLRARLNNHNLVMHDHIAIAAEFGRDGNDVGGEWTQANAVRNTLADIDLNIHIAPLTARNQLIMHAARFLLIHTD